MKTAAVLFDVFGTLIKIHNRRSPYLQLLRHGRAHGRRPMPDDSMTLMTHAFSLSEAAIHLGIPIGYVKLQRMERLLQEELSSLALHDDASDAIAVLQSAGIKVGLCSNLAAPYGPAVRELLPGIDAYGFSYELGLVKPDPIIYESVCRMLGVEPGKQLGGDRVVMIGDSVRCDQDGAKAAGIAGFHLSRAGRGDFSNLIKFAECVLKG
ncbi:HAD family hydrolase [Pseudomonas chengduensis]|nr:MULTISPECIES: HAD-IA family hydrolase [Pseudomonas]MDH1283709.1 HAD family hydrolase [Pseudomonas chengduensis]TRO27000.1 HAD family hydrolase [Pseudomonas sp. ALS1279]